MAFPSRYLYLLPCSMHFVPFLSSVLFFHRLPSSLTETIFVPFHRLLLQDSIYFFSLKSLLFTFTGSVSFIPFTAFSSCHHLHFHVFHRLVFLLSEIVLSVSYLTIRLIFFYFSVEMLLCFYSLASFSLFHRLLLF